MSIIYRLELDPTGNTPADKLQYGLCSYGLVRQSFLARQVLTRLGEWFGGPGAGSIPFVLRKDPPLTLRWRAQNTSATGTIDANNQVTSAFLLLSGQDPRDETAASSHFGLLMTREAQRFASAVSTDVRRYERRPLLVTVTAPEAAQTELDLDLLHVCIAGAFFERSGAVE